MSQSTKTNTRPLYYTFILFLFSNILFIYFFLSHSIFPIAIQMFIFLITAINGILIFSLSYRRDLLLLTTLFLIYFPFLYFTFFIDIKDLFVGYIWVFLEVFASSVSVLGSFLLASNNVRLRFFAYISFLIGDSILAYIGYDKMMYPFMFQSLFFIGTSSLGIYNLKK